ncbi:peroxisomal membrane anchor protein conserved region-domain-containing protein [Pilobolus umbonatus]|nr:peroxisomal membrane anchor protein conserved region-domain-containing protein [Pilobolus umbonatus]
MTDMREDLLTSAESFLSSPQVISSDKSKKVEFLKKKGLTEEEITEAFRRVENKSIDDQPVEMTLQQSSVVMPTTTYPSSQIIYYPPPPPERMATQQLLMKVVLIGLGLFGITSGITLVIKKCMSNLLGAIGSYQGNRYKQYEQLFHRMEMSLKSHTLDRKHQVDAYTGLNKSLHQLSDKLEIVVKEQNETNKEYQDLNLKLSQLKSSSSQYPYRHSTINTYDPTGFAGMSGYTSSHNYQPSTTNDAAIQNLKSEIRSIKGMLLSRRTFPTAKLPS